MVADPATLSHSLEAGRLLASETSIQYGPVPHELGGIGVGKGCHRMAENAFLLRTASGLNFFYRKGEAITIEREAGCDPSDEGLWLNGSVYAAVASINGFKPLHASAVAFEGQAYAFTGPSGAGKSTLVAALGSRGLPMFCDDTLVLDLSDPQAVTCLPGHKRLKLSAEALALSGAAQEEPVSPAVPKFYAQPAAGDVREPLPLAALVFLEEGPAEEIQPICGAERFVRLDDDHYTEHLFMLAHQPDRAAQFALRARLAQQIPMARLMRPRDTTCFDASVDCAFRYITGTRGTCDE